MPCHGRGEENKKGKIGNIGVKKKVTKSMQYKHKEIYLNKSNKIDNVNNIYMHSVSRNIQRKQDCTYKVMKLHGQKKERCTVK